MSASLHRRTLPGERSLRSRLAQLASGERFLRGTLSERSSKCGKPNCHCVDGEGHRALYLVQSHSGKVRQLCVPNALQDPVREAVAEYQGCSASLTKFPNWSGNASWQGRPDRSPPPHRVCQEDFQFSEAVVANVADRRPQPRIPTAGIVKAVAALFWARMGSLNALELFARSRFFHRWLGQSVSSADSIGRVFPLVDADGLRQGIHQIYDRLRRNKALPNHGGIPIAVLDGHESHASYLRHCARCLERTIHTRNGDRTQFYHRQVTLILLPFVRPGRDAVRLLLDHEPHWRGHFDERRSAEVRHDILGIQLF